MDEKLFKDVEALVKSIFSEKEEADMREKTQDALQASAKTIDELTTALESKNVEVTEVATKISEFESTVATLTSELEAAKTASVEAAKKLEEAEAKIIEMLKDKTQEARIIELESAGVLRKDKDAQVAKIREMSDTDFATYKDELVSIRESVVSELKAQADKLEQEKAASDAAAAAAGDTNDGEGVVTPPAKIDPSTAMTAALNMELAATPDIAKKYSDLGKAMAKMLTND